MVGWYGGRAVGLWGGRVLGWYVAGWVVWW